MTNNDDVYSIYLVTAGVKVTNFGIQLANFVEHKSNQI